MRSAPISLVAAAALLVGAGTATAATFTVNTTSDSVDTGGCGTPQAVCSLRDAVIAANQVNGASTIALGTGDYKLTIQDPTHLHGAESGDLNYAGGAGPATNSLTVTGEGPSSTTIDATGLGDRIFHVMCPMTFPCPTAATSLTINGVTLAGGTGTVDLIDPAASNANDHNTAKGGAIVFDPGGSLTLTGDAFNDNQAVAAGGTVNFAEGGAIDAGNGSTVEVTNSTFTANKALGDGTTGGSEGGAIYGIPGYGLQQNGATMQIVNSTFTGNLSGGGGGEDYGEGGAVLNFGANTTISGSTFTGNRAGGGGGDAYAEGGAVYGELTLTITGGTFTGNTAGGGGGGAYGEGGAVYEDFGPASITGATFTGNSAGGGGNGGAGAYGEGGAIYNDGFAPITIAGTTVSGNTAGGGDANSYGQGGGIYTGVFSDVPSVIQSSTISGNTVGGGDASSEPEGGGIYGEDSLTVTDSTIANNTAGDPNGGSGDGGGIDAVVSLNSSTVSGNRVLVGNGVAGGGGIDGALTIHNSIISGNFKGPSTPNNCSGGAISSQGHNIENGTTCTLSKPGDLNADPKLGALANNGGGIETMALLPGSPAINAGDNSGCPAKDERGIARPQPAGGSCDIGAYEYSPAATTGKPGWTCSAAGNFAITVTGAAGAAGPVAIHYKLDGAAEQRVPVSTNPATVKVAVPAGAHTIAYWGESQGGSVEAQHTFTLHCVGSVVSQLKVKPAKFVPATSGGSVIVKSKPHQCANSTGRSHVPRCTVVSYKDSLASTTTFKVERLVKCLHVKGHGSKKGCKSHYVKVAGSFHHADKPGANAFKFSGRVGGHALAAGSYKLIATPAAGAGGVQATAKFTIA